MQTPQTPQKLPPRAPSPQGFSGGAAFSPKQGIGASQASVAAAAAARARAAEQMAYEDAWKASNPDFKTPFASVEDAVSRLLPYHVFADYEEDDDVCEGNVEKSSAERWDEQINEVMSAQISELEKKVLIFNVMAGKRAEGTMRGEEKLMLDHMLLQDERRMTEHVRAALIAQHEKQQQEEAARAAAARLAQAQAGGSGPWTLVQQPTPSAWQQALAAAAVAARGQGRIPVPGQMAAPGVAQIPPQQPHAAAAAGVWMMQQQQHHHQQQQQHHHHHHQQQQQQHHQQQQLALGVWPTFVAARGEGSSSSNGQAGVPGVWQGQGQGQGQAGVGQATSGAPAAGMAQTWWASDAQKREQ